MTQTVLIIDDNPEIHELLEARLAPEGLRIEHALAADDGMRRAVEGQPDLILLDLSLPTQDGFELCQALKADPSTTMIPIVFLTANHEVDAKVRGFDAGGVDYVTKPFEVAELRARVRAALRTMRYQKLLAARAQIDALTGLWNRGYCNQRLEQEVAAARRYQRTLSFLLLDLDHFKSLNDRHGHPFGDQVLQRVGDALGLALRATDAACRFGGEEFAIIMSDTSCGGAMVVAQRVREQLASIDLRSRGQRLTLTASFGLSGSEQFTDPRTLTPANLIRIADHALYAAKRSGRDRICTASVSEALEQGP